MVPYHTSYSPGVTAIPNLTLSKDSNADGGKVIVALFVIQAAISTHLKLRNVLIGPSTSFTLYTKT
jgi:hypothetical protein